MAGIDIYNLASSQDVLKSMECPICLDVPIPPIFNCVNGHFICNHCREKSNSCSLCSGAFTTMRNYPLEAIVRSSTFRCKNEAVGCRSRILGDEYAAHLNKCEFRPINCNHSSTIKCTNVTVPYNQYIEHLTNIHGCKTLQYIKGGIVVKDQAINLDITTSMMWPVTIISCQDNTWLFRRMKVDQKIFYIWFTYFGPDINASCYDVEIQLFKTGGKGNLSWTIPAYSFRTTVDEIQKLAFHFAIPITHLQTFCDKLGGNVFTWNTKYIITRKMN